jgi:hypothetical protein
VALGDTAGGKQHDDGAEGARVRILLFDAEGDDQVLDEASIDPDALAEQQLLWVDLETDGIEPTLSPARRLMERLRLGPRAPALLRALAGRTCTTSATGFSSRSPPSNTKARCALPGARWSSCAGRTSY